MSGLLSQKWHNKKSSWRFVKADCFTDEAHSYWQRTWNLDEVLKRAHQARSEMQDFGDKLASHLGGVFILAPNKTREQALISISFENDEAPLSDLADFTSTLLDPVRGCILVDDVADIPRVRKKLRSIVDYKQSQILSIDDRYLRPSTNGPRGIFMLAEMPHNNVIGEVQIHTRAYWAAMNEKRDIYEEFRRRRYEWRCEFEKVKMEEDAEEKEDNSSLSCAWDSYSWDSSNRASADVEVYKKKRKANFQRIAEETGVIQLESKDVQFEGDCTYPMRPAIDARTGEFGYMVPAHMMEQFRKEYRLERPQPKY